MTEIPAWPADGGFALYVHWPFCKAKCPYCDFNSHVRESIDHARWRAALVAELEHYAARVDVAPEGRPLDSIFFGGGTPSLMEPATAGAVIARARALWGLAPDAEITLEANPTSVEAERFAGFRAAGVNRVSLGVQSLDAQALAFLGRQHSAGEALAAVALAHAQFPRVSFDLITARPGLSLDAWERELDAALAHAGEHISIYQLTIEEGTPFHAARRRGDLAELDADTAAAVFERTQGRLAAAGRPAYEISNHARPGAESRHNLVYWRLGHWVGIGPGAHGRIRAGGATRMTRQHRAPEAWLEQVERQGHATRSDEPVGAAEMRTDLFMMGLRLAAGVERSRCRAVLGAAIEDVLDRTRLGTLVDGGFLALDDAGLRATPSGLQRLDAVLEALL